MNAEKRMISLFENKNVMIIAPHQDDEINIAGSLIFQLRKIATCHVVYMTNGDYYLDAARRQCEAENALACLGIKKKNITYMGYPDVSEFKDKCVYQTSYPKKFVSKANYEHTYASGKREEYIYIKEGIHHGYNKENYLKDLEHIILDRRPDYIITNDMDLHVNHIELSVMIEEALCEILKENENYTPKLLKTYAYDLAFYGIQDYSAYNLSESKNQNTGLNPCLKWKNRLRLPVPGQARAKLLTHNIIYRAMWRHHSQTGYLFASGIANSDKVYWMRRTDSQSYKASVFASSGEIEYLNDFRMFHLGEDLNINYTKLWVPDKDDFEKKFRMTFQREIDIDNVVLYENILPENHIISARIVFSNGYEKVVDDIEKDGSASVVYVDTQKKIRWLEFIIEESIGDFAGLTEIEVYEPQKNKIWFIKLILDDNYVYTYHTDRTKIIPNVVVYDIYGNILDSSKEKIHIVYEDNGEEKEILGEVNLKNKKRKIVIKAFCEDDPNLYDKITVIKDNNIFMKEKILQAFNMYVEFLYKGIDWFINELIRMKQVGIISIIKKVLFH